MRINRTNYVSSGINIHNVICVINEVSEVVVAAAGDGHAGGSWRARGGARRGGARSGAQAGPGRRAGRASGDGGAGLAAADVFGPDLGVALLELGHDGDAGGVFEEDDVDAVADQEVEVAGKGLRLADDDAGDLEQQDRPGAHLA